MEYKIIKYDFVGVLSAVLCTLHCLASPIAIAISRSSFGSLSFLWEIINYLFFVISLVSVVKCSHSKHFSSIKYIQYIALALLGGSIVFHSSYEILDIVAYISSGVLVTSHIINILSLKLR